LSDGLTDSPVFAIVLLSGGKDKERGDGDMSRLICVVVSAYWARQLAKVIKARRFSGCEAAEYARDYWHCGREDAKELSDWACSLF
jgi:hypothetical protein